MPQFSHDSSRRIAGAAAALLVAVMIANSAIVVFKLACGGGSLSSVPAYVCAYTCVPIAFVFYRSVVHDPCSFAALQAVCMLHCGINDSDTSNVINPLITGNIDRERSHKFYRVVGAKWRYRRRELFGVAGAASAVWLGVVSTIAIVQWDSTSTADRVFLATRAFDLISFHTLFFPVVHFAMICDCYGAALHALAQHTFDGDISLNRCGVLYSRTVPLIRQASMASQAFVAALMSICTLSLFVCGVATLLGDLNTLINRDTLLDTAMTFCLPLCSSVIAVYLLWVMSAVAARAEDLAQVVATPKPARQGSRQGGGGYRGTGGPQALVGAISELSAIEMSDLMEEGSGDQRDEVTWQARVREEKGEGRWERGGG